MRGIQLFFLSVLCVASVGWMWKDNPKVRENMQKGYQAWQAGNRTEALTYYEEALALKPDEVDALNSVGVIYEELGVPAKAEAKYLAAIKVNYKFLSAYFNLGVLYWNQGDMEKAAQYFQKRVDLGNPQDPWTIKAKKSLDNIKSDQALDRQSDIHQTVQQFDTAVPKESDHQQLVDQALDQVGHSSGSQQPVMKEHKVKEIPKAQEIPKVVQQEEVIPPQVQPSDPQYDQPSYGSSDRPGVLGTIGHGFHWLWENI